MSFEAVAFHNWGPLKTIFLRLLGTPRSIIWAAPWLLRRFSRSVEKVWASELTDSGCLLHITWKKHPSLSHDNCLTLMGGIASMPLRWGSPPAQVEEEQCAFQGHPATVLRMTWLPHTLRLRLRGIFRGVNAGRARFLVDSLNEHARQVELLTEKSREMSRALAQEQRRFQALAQNIPLGVAFLDAQGRFLYGNPALDSISGYLKQGHQLATVKDWFQLAIPDPVLRRKVSDAWQANLEAGRGRGPTAHLQGARRRLAATRTCCFGSGPWPKGRTSCSWKT